MLRLVEYMLEIADKKLTEEMIKEFHKILKEGEEKKQREIAQKLLSQGIDIKIIIKTTGLTEKEIEKLEINT